MSRQQQLQLQLICRDADWFTSVLRSASRKSASLSTSGLLITLHDYYYQLLQPFFTTTDRMHFATLVFILTVFGADFSLLKMRRDWEKRGREEEEWWFQSGIGVKWVNITGRFRLEWTDFVDASGGNEAADNSYLLVIWRGDIYHCFSRKSEHRSGWLPNDWLTCRRVKF